ncbi:MAG: hypothetical protein FWC43_11680 [Planctomycetaceae bacterium]|nr:hypothetical protein [Planctomycetaceae bacterium]
MANFFYTDANGQKRGPINDQQLKNLATQGIVTPNTPLETDSGHKGLAGQVPGLKFGTGTPSPFVQPTQKVPVPQPTPKQLFCTNCGNSISERAVACMSCGVKPTGHRKFCRQCGVGLNSEQIVCIKCGSEIKTIDTEKIIGEAMNNLGKGIRHLSTSATSRGMTVGDIIIFAAAALAFLSFFLTWIEIPRRFWEMIGPRNGFSAHAFWFGIIFIFPVWMALTKKRESIHQIGGYLCAGIGLCLGIMHRKIYISLAVGQFLRAHGTPGGPGYFGGPGGYPGVSIEEIVRRMTLEVYYATSTGVGAHLFICVCILLIVGIALIRKPFSRA